jgi:hypothetical protein
MMFMYVLIAEHVLSYLFGMFRDYDIKHNGKKDRHGIESAQREGILRILEVIIDIGIAAWIMISMISQDSATFNSLPFLNFWIMCDMIIMVITLPYTYVSKFMMISGEITKNIFTLYQVQKRKLKERKEKVEAIEHDKNSPEWRDFKVNYFRNQEKEFDAEDMYKTQ